eukprot:124351-Prymnesium_polylepis.1
MLDGGGVQLHLVFRDMAGALAALTSVLCELSVDVRQVRGPVHRAAHAVGRFASRRQPATCQQPA